MITLSRKAIVSLTAGSAALALTLLAPPAQAVVVANCTTTATKVVTAKTVDSIASASFVNIPAGTVTFTQGTHAGCVIVRFSVEILSAAPSNSGSFQALLDNVTIAEPGEVRYSVAEIASAARSFEFLFPKVMPGSHTLRMQIQTTNGGSIISLRTLSIQYSP